MDINQIKSAYESKREELLKELTEFLSFESISTDPAYEQQTRDCADWCKSFLEKIGFSARLEETSGLPLVIGHYEQKDKPTILFYGHYDVQPAGALEDWASPPFEPTIRDGRIYARGAVDDKGQVFFVLKALQYLIENDALDYSVKIVLEGEEESGSEGINSSLNKLAEELSADTLLVCDTSMVALDQPTIMIGLRGACFLNLELQGPNRELHSGHHGGIAPNPAIEMSRLLASFVDTEGKIQVEGYYEQVQQVSDEVAALLAEIPFDAAAYEKEIGVPPVAGEQEFPPVVRMGLRPTIEVNGIESGFAGPGVKTIVPDVAKAAVSSRLAPGQDPQHSLSLIKAHLEKYAPKGLTLKTSGEEAAGTAVLVDPKGASVQRSAEILEELYAKKPLFKCNGGSIPVIAELARVTASTPLLVGFSHDTDRLHAVNESFGLDRLEMGFCYAAAFLSQAC